jgi:glycosyltransferase involved in cell wall biosynthesis
MTELTYDVIIPAWNAQSTILETLVSIAEQTIKPQRIIVVDDGSTDQTKSVVEQSGLATHVVSTTNAGPGAATSKGFEFLVSDIAAFCDADDIWVPNKAEKQLDHLTTLTDVTAVCCDMLPFRLFEGERQFGPARETWGRSVLMIRTSAVMQIGLIIDPVGFRGEIVDWIARAREMGLKFDYLKQSLAYRRISPTSLSYQRQSGKDKGYLQVVHAALLRKRLKGEAT